jgi:Protein kinase domain
MHHPSIVEFYRAFAFEDYTYVVLELCPNGSLMDMVKTRKSLSLPEVRRYMIQLCGGVKYMHQRCVIHRDLKMGNIFIDTHMNIKIGDFGLAAVVVDDKHRRQTMCGTPNYIAPELLARSSERGHGHEVDTWAIGVICYAMLIGTPPFASKSQTEIYAKLKQLQYEWKEDCQYFIPKQAKDLVTLCLNLVPAERPGMDDLVEHDFFKMGAIADELDRSCLRSRPIWLEHADPRGDKVMSGYGVDHAAICEASGVGKTATGRLRPSVGANVNVSAMDEVDFENAKGCAPIIPMPEGVVYKEFTAAKEGWNAIRKRPLTVPKVRSRKEPAVAAGTLDMKSLSRTLAETESARNTTPSVASSSATTSIAPLRQQRPSVQSFAAQQRQQAIPSAAFSRRIISTQSTKADAIAEEKIGDPEQETQRERASQDLHDAEAQSTGGSIQSSRGFLREQPVRAVQRVTRSTSKRHTTRDIVPNVPELSSVVDQRNIRLHSDEIERPVRVRPARPATGIRTASHSRPHRGTSSRETRPDAHPSLRPSSPSSNTTSASKPLQIINANDRQPKSAITASTAPEVEPLKPVPIPFPSKTTSIVIGPNDISTLIPGSSFKSVLKSLREIYHDLSPRNAVRPIFSDAYHKPESNAHTLVEKWVDYTERYGIGYILNDGGAGLALKTSPDNARSSCCVVIRNARDHYLRRIREEDMQIVPQGPHAAPVEFYESLDGDGIRKMRVSAKAFCYDNLNAEKWVDGKDVVAQLSEQANGEYAAERVRLVGLLDKFGKYMTNLNASEVEAKFDAKAGAFIRFYQRLGNVGIWGFGDGAFQFNFPDHTKLIMYRSSKTDGQNLMLDIYYLHPEDANYLAKYGSMAEGSMERRDSLTAPIAEIYGWEGKDCLSIITSNQVLEKLSWIRAVVGVWVQEGGLGKTGKERLAWAGLQNKATENGKRTRMVWVTVGKDGGDEAGSRRS